MQIEIHSNDAGPELWISYADGASDSDSWNARALVQNFLGNNLQIVGCHSELTRNWIIRVKPTPQAQPEPTTPNAIAWGLQPADPPAPTPPSPGHFLQIVTGFMLIAIAIGSLAIGLTLHSAIEQVDQILSFSVATVCSAVGLDFIYRGFRRG